MNEQLTIISRTSEVDHESKDWFDETNDPWFVLTTVTLSDGSKFSYRQPTRPQFMHLDYCEISGMLAKTTLFPVYFDGKPVYDEIGYPFLLVISHSVNDDEKVLGFDVKHYKLVRAD